ncbi:MFS transporter [Gracilibacillus alcaliphilus]|uniref:MFS transporter n=1 Tax=Gracilibacillus alcaliphilus TaxID=1401441 RepID=UPI00195DACA8|nr:MFS transporter [Gracilibacillus alcaliphilus]MBM7678061.1 EmrB/QacA subfamily drug resistance transporter [Gracilibacillus alcaliphilus]
MKSVVQNQRNTNQRSSNRYLALVFLSLAQFIVVLDSSIVNIALPSIGNDLLLHTDTLSWIIVAFVVPLGGLLLLGGRLADRFGHRRIFMVGAIGIMLGSAMAGLSTSIEMLLVARAIQGVSAAFLSPAALALVTMLFTEPKERAKALGIWGIVAGIGSGAGVLLGGVLISMFGWSSVFFINVPIALLIIVSIPILVTKDTKTKNMKTDVLGAVTVTAGLLAFITAFSAGEQVEMMTMLILILIGIVLLIAFVFIEKRAKGPLVPFSIFRNASVTKGNVAMLLLGGAAIGLFFGLSVYMQNVLEYDALTTGLAQLPLVVALIIGAGMVPVVMEQIGIERTLVFSLLLFSTGLIWLSFAPSNASFMVHLLGPTLVVGVGVGASLVASTTLAVDGVAQREKGLAGGLVNSSQQIGGALGITILIILSSTRTDSLISQGDNMADALTGGFSWVFIGGAVFAIIGALLVIIAQRKAHTPSARSSVANQESQ